ncbi:hypothetical protein AAG906_026367 [Vitis piasezkii]
MEHLLTPRDFFYPRIAMDFYQSMTTNQVRDPTLIHFTIDGRHVLLEALYKMSEGFFFGPHHLILAALLYFEEKVHKKKLQRADCIPLLFPRLLCQILEHLGYPSSLTGEKANLRARRTSQDIYRGYSSCSAIPRAPPLLDFISTIHISEPRMAIPISEYRELCHALETLTTSRAVLLKRWQPLSMPRADVGHSGSTSCHLKAAPSPFRSATSCRALHFYSSKATLSSLRVSSSRAPSPS